MSAERSERPGPGRDPAADPTPATRAGSGGLPSSGPSATAAGASATAVPRGGLARYVIAATLARTPTGGAVVGIVLLVTVHSGPEWSAGLLAACITAPHLLGPFVARSLDVVRDGRLVLVLACLLHGGLLIAAVLLYPLLPLLAVAALLVGSGLAGPLIMGGVSSRLPDIVAPDQRSQRRAQAWDVASYGLSGTLGPALIAAVAQRADPAVALVALAGTAVCAAAFMMLLPRAKSQAPGTVALRPPATLRVMLGHGPLRRTLYLTTSVALAVAALPVAAVGFAAVTGSEAAAAGTLTAAYGAGGLGASVLLMVRPLRTDADRSMTWFAASVAAMLALTLVSTTLWVALVLYAVVGACNSIFFATTLAARSEFAPDTARAQIFVWVGALKIASVAAGTALAGALIGPGVLLPVAVAAAVAGLAAALSQLERRRA